ncbi:HlyD family type I secretion periplasmic adaptor subunit [Shinella sp. JR1-6]|uniref:HlyD family type I secretion periplasmic adaptor subunit n=1 Tax=Shinella sp. JR1-6 TaxID=2527671 RepID=UPI00102D4B24|nr:HlyD family type I secretion periplasmic adaptor subunit [Shinella sp. JR1-6]TAA51738.1 HlyD family type I secretion periplasmic adaptor subunit [Shinella sp. JR1-6]
MSNDNLSQGADNNRPAAPTLSGLKLETLQSWSDAIPTSRRKPMLAAGLVLVALFGFGGAWAATAKLGGALIVSGRVIAEGNNRVMQHLEGGIIENIRVNEGDSVRRGDVIVQLDETATRSQLDRMYIERALATIELERWRAERDDVAEDFSIASERLAPVTDNPRVIEAYQSQVAEFKSTRQALRQKLLVLDGKIANEQEDLVSLKDQVIAIDAQRELIVKEEADLADLLSKGLTQRSRVLALQREAARLNGQKSNAQATIQKSHHNIRSFGDEKQRLIAEHAAETNQKITELQQRLNQTEDMINRLDDRMRRADIIAPVDGVVLSMPFKSLGAVIKPGEKIADILPKDAPLLFEVPILPQDITKIFMDQNVEIIFSSDQVTVTPPLKGKVVYISADTITMPSDPRVSYYVTHVRMESEHHGRNILPGNVAELFFQTEARTLLQHLADPVTRFALRTYKD